MPMAIQAGLWGLLSGSALLIGAAIGWYLKLPQRLIAAIMAFGAGVLISALSFELMEEAWQRGGFLPVAGGFLGGAAIYTVANLILAHRGARHRKRSGAEGKRQKEADKNPENGMALALGALLDGIPESIVIGVSLIEGGSVGLVAVAAVFLSNLPEGLSSAAGLKSEGKSAAYNFGLWTGIAVISGLASLIGYIAFAGVDPAAVAFVQALAAGAILAMIVDTMVPEAFEGTHDYAGLIAVSGFLTAFGLSKLG
ncbi:ZIP family zinc transporter [Sphingomonas sp. KRR8]|uniref:ZIP family metal transporter n=1 Tax=Sphingomonas sp. KRR8 TaxID=2942996 RepID=UPI002021D754|nr:ZIP family zinc transporter [Sphingomonas sp. KRR8]URD61718.1 ZIP family zinc transporter [Sphingomonas sp. KRR8]